MRTEKVSAMGWSSDSTLRTMGNLVDEGILKKEYVTNREAGSPDIVWTNISQDVIVDNGMEVISPGESAIWVK